MLKLIRKPLLLAALSCCILNNIAQAQTITQTIKGQITDKASKELLPGATVILIGTDPVLGASSGADGKFKITHVPVGRYDLKISSVGYNDIIIPNVVVTAGKEVVLDIETEETVAALNEIVIAATQKSATNNEMTTNSSRSFSMEEVSRYAGGRSDPARLAANFAGVSAPDDSRNDIVIRGNSPTGVLWLIEGLHIPNPNHFATNGTTGSAVSALNTNVLRNSDFFTSAFPAEYGNALSGVFDIGFRNGNSEKREHTLQLGALTGVEVMTEGPINKEKGSAYLLAYRYSFTGLAQAIGLNIGTTATPFYQDLTFKITGANTKLGQFTLFGLGGVSKITFKHDEIDSADLFADPGRDIYFTSNIGLAGVKHFKRVNDKSYFSTVIGATYYGSEYNLDSINKINNTALTIQDGSTITTRYSLHTSYNSKINTRFLMKAGIKAEVVNYNLLYRDRELLPYWQEIWSYNDFATLYEAYVQGKYKFTDKFLLNAGLHSQYLTLNTSPPTVEPRLGLKYTLNEKNTVSIAYGLHSLMQPTDVYFYRQPTSPTTYDDSNLELDFTKSHHLVAGYDWLPASDWRVKAEIYYQQLFNVPVSAVSSGYSVLNHGSTFVAYNNGILVNKGTGTNAGAELTIERFFSKGYYGLVTGSLFDSKYKGSDGVERNTAFNGKYVYNILIGKELKIGKEKRNAITLDIKMTQAGGRYYTPVDLAASQALQDEVPMGDAYLFSQRYPDFFRLDVKTSFVINSKKRNVAQSLYFDIQNITNNKNVFAIRYNRVTNSINTGYQIGFFPNFGYKVQF